MKKAHRSKLGVQIETETASLRAELQSWKKLNEQRLEEVYAARKILDVTPNETLSMAIERYTIKNPLIP